jgi:hypothetical protein
MNREIAKVSAHHALTAATLKDAQFTSSAIPMPALCRRHTRDGANDADTTQVGKWADDCQHLTFRTNASQRSQARNDHAALS